MERRSRTCTKKMTVTRKKAKQFDDYDDLKDISDKLDQIVQRSQTTEQKLEALERMKRLEAIRAPKNESTEKAHLGLVFGQGPPPSRPPTSSFKVPKQHFARAHDVTLDQIFEALQCLREEVDTLAENHSEMVNQINTIKKLIQ